VDGSAHAVTIITWLAHAPRILFLFYSLSQNVTSGISTGFLETIGGQHGTNLRAKRSAMARVQGQLVAGRSEAQAENSHLLNGHARTK
jgi:hypothetical protein